MYPLLKMTKTAHLYKKYLNRIHKTTFLPFRAYSIDNQLIIDIKTVQILNMPKTSILNYTKQILKYKIPSPRLQTSDNQQYAVKDFFIRTMERNVFYVYRPMSVCQEARSDYLYSVRCGRELPPEQYG